MAGSQTPALSLDQMLQESRKKRKAEELAQEIFGKKNRSRTPQGPRAKPAPGASLASRVGVMKQQRTSSLNRTNSAPAPRNNRPPPARPALNDSFRARSTFNNQQPSSDPVSSEPKSNGYQRYDAPPAAANGGGNISFRGAAQAGPYIVVAQNFAPGTTAADIESVMADVGGAVTDCHLVATNPTVIAEMAFSDKSGAETVINTFNGKKADGRTLNVYLKSGGGAKLPTFVQDVEPMAEDTMELDENAQSREAEDRLREERRGGPPRNDRGPPPHQGGFPTGPKDDRGYQDDYYRGPRRAEPAYQDGRYGFGGGDRYGGGRGGGGYRNGGGRMYSDRMGRGGQSWRP